MLHPRTNAARPSQCGTTTTTTTAPRCQPRPGARNERPHQRRQRHHHVHLVNICSQLSVNRRECDLLRKEVNSGICQAHQGFGPGVQAVGKGITNYLIVFLKGNQSLAVSHADSEHVVSTHTLADLGAGLPAYVKVFFAASLIEKYSLLSLLIGMTGSLFLTIAK